MITDSPVNNHKDLLKVVDGLLEGVGLDRKDPDGEDLELIFDVNMPDCSPVRHLGNIFVVNCLNNAPHSGIACAEDPDGNTSSRAAFEVPVCVPGDCIQFPNLCADVTRP